MYDKLKSVTRGYGTMDYEVIGFRPADLVKMDILVKGEPRRRAVNDRASLERRTPRPSGSCKKLKEEISQASVRNRRSRRPSAAEIIARETISALQKERDRQMLRRRHHPQTQTAGKAERRQETDEAIRRSRNPAEGVPGGAQHR